MSTRRTSLRAGILAVVLAGVGLAAPATAAPPYPTGTFTILGPTTRYLGGYASPVHGGTFLVSIDALSPDARVEGINTGAPDSSNDRPEYGYDGVGGRLSLDYTGPGTFVPRVFVSDSSGQTTVVALPPVTVLLDTTPPTGDITLPAPGVRRVAAAWRDLTGHRADPQTRIASVMVHLMQRRGGIWYVYSSTNQRWRRGTRSETGTYKTVVTSNRQALSSGGDEWFQPTVKGLTKGLLVIRVTVRNRAGLEARLPVVRQYLAN